MKQQKNIFFTSVSFEWRMVKAWCFLSFFHYSTAMRIIHQLIKKTPFSEIPAKPSVVKIEELEAVVQITNWSKIFMKAIPNLHAWSHTLPKTSRTRGFKKLALQKHFENDLVQAILAIRKHWDVSALHQSSHPATKPRPNRKQMPISIHLSRNLNHKHKVKKYQDILRTYKSYCNIVGRRGSHLIASSCMIKLHTFSKYLTSFKKATTKLQIATSLP